MKAVTTEWVAKAEGDFAAAQQLLRVRKNPNYDAACYHAQQCAEKYLKGRLTEAGIAFPKTHALAALLDLVLPVEPLWDPSRADLTDLSNFAVAFRYPGESATKADAKDALARCRRFRAVARAAMGLP